MNDICDTTTGSSAGPAGPDPGAAGPSPPYRRLVRSTTDRKVAGVAGGLGAYFGIDPVIFRLGLVLATFFGGTGLIAYAIAWIVLPEGDTAAAGSSPRGEDDTSSLISLIVGGFLLVVGVATLFDLADIGFLWPVSWPFAMIAAGIAVIVWARRRNDDADPPPDGPGRTEGDGPASPSPAAVTVPEPTAAGDDLLPVPYDAGAPTEVVDVGGTGGGDDEAGPGSPEGEPEPEEASAPHRRRGISATALTVAAIFLFAGAATLGHLADWWDLAPGTVLGGALVLCGAGLVASAWLGRGLLLIPLGILCALGLVVATWIDVPIRGGIGERTVAPTAVGELDEPVRLAIGSLELDLSRLDFAGIVEVESSVAIGELRIVVPDDVALDLDARSGMGQVVLEGTGISPFTRDEGGLGASIDQRVASDVRPDDVIELDADVGMGQVVVQRVPAPDRPAEAAPPSTTTSSPPATSAPSR